ncbi:restriction endonuclease subunit S [Paenarthrobacter nitroguajacolicus]|uniref:restriction endonuclease subunit S n=1 Tax=Paenarthrobacter nitroguajacolicus TaxID=211146 RepID=UPI00142ED85A|nr:restriction endonuclease subunit S [Paenarthrobacter nitroguajacolicus]
MPLVKVARVVSGGTPKTAVAEYWDGDIPWATPKDLSSLRAVEIHSTPRGLTPAGLNASSAEVLPANSVLFSSRAPIGLLAINSVPMATNQGFKSFVPDPTQLEARYLYRWLEFNRKWLQSLGVGATFKEVSKATVSRIELPLPSLAEQRRIAAILDKADELRGKRRQAIAHLNTLTQSIFHSMFGTTTWPTKNLGDLAMFRYGSSNKSAGAGEECLRIPNVVGGQIDWSNLKLVPVTNDELDRLRLLDNDLLFVRSNGNPDYVGRAAVFSSRDESNVIYASYLIRARFHDFNALSPRFAHAYLESTSGRDQLRSGAKTSAGQYNINTQALGALKIPVPPLELQQTFANRVAAVERLKETHRKHLAELDALFASLQSRAFKGEL